MGDIDRLMKDQECKKIRQRQVEGIAVATSQEKHLGPPQLTLSKLSQNLIHIIEETYPNWKNRNITSVKIYGVICTEEKYLL